MEISGVMTIVKIEKLLAKRLQSLKDLARRTVGEAWEVGRLLTEAKSTLKHGGWLPWLEAQGVNYRTSQRYMLLYEEFTEVQIEGYESVDSALKALPGRDDPPEPDTPPPTPEPDPEPAASGATEDVKQVAPPVVEKPPTLTKAEKALVEIEHLSEKALALSNVVEEKDAEIEVLKERVAMTEESERPEMAERLNTLTNVQQQLKTCKSKRFEQAQIIKELKKEKAWLKRELKKVRE